MKRRYRPVMVSAGVIAALSSGPWAIGAAAQIPVGLDSALESVAHAPDTGARVRQIAVLNAEEEFTAAFSERPTPTQIAWIRVLGYITATPTGYEVGVVDPTLPAAAVVGPLVESLRKWDPGVTESMVVVRRMQRPAGDVILPVDLPAGTPAGDVVAAAPAKAVVVENPPLTG